MHTFIYAHITRKHIGHAKLTVRIWTCISQHLYSALRLRKSLCFSVSIVSSPFVLTLSSHYLTILSIFAHTVFSVLVFLHVPDTSTRSSKINSTSVSVTKRCTILPTDWRPVHSWSTSFHRKTRICELLPIFGAYPHTRKWTLRDASNSSLCPLLQSHDLFILTWEDRDMNNQHVVFANFSRRSCNKNFETVGRLSYQQSMPGMQDFMWMRPKSVKSDELYWTICFMQHTIPSLPFTETMRKKVLHEVTWKASPQKGSTPSNLRHVAELMFNLHFMWLYIKERKSVDIAWQMPARVRATCTDKLHICFGRLDEHFKRQSTYCLMRYVDVSPHAL